MAPVKPSTSQQTIDERERALLATIRHRHNGNEIAFNRFMALRGIGLKMRESKKEFCKRLVEAAKNAPLPENPPVA